jgi:O-antigen biosynthesis protein
LNFLNEDIRRPMAHLTSMASHWVPRLRRLRRRIAPDGSAGHRLLQRVMNRRRASARARVPDGPPQITLLLVVEKADAATVGNTVASVLEQTEGRWQLLLIGDAPVSPAADVPADPRIERCAAGDAGRAGALNAGLDRARGEFVAVLDAGDQLVPEALDTMVSEARRLHADVAYSDEATLQDAGPPSHLFAKPDWSPELLLSFPYTGRLCLLRREMVRSLGGWNSRTAAAEDYALVLAAARRGAVIRRVDRTLYRRWQTHITQICGTPAALDARRAAVAEHLAARGAAAQVVPDAGPGKLRVRWPIAQPPLVSIVIATRDRIGLLDQCIQSIVSRTQYPRYEIVIVDNDSGEEASAKYFAQTPHRVVCAPGPFNFPAINNAGARAARGDYLLFLNNDTEVVAPDWLEAMLEWGQLPEIGCVGAKLLFADGRIQHAGVTLHDGSAFHPGYGQRPGDTTWTESEVVRNFSAVTAACLLVRRSLFEEVGGFDESFPVAYNDVVLCVRVMAKGLRNLYTPYAVLYHHESSSRPPGVKISENEHLQAVVGQLLWIDPYCPADQRSAPSRPDLLERASSRARNRLGRVIARATAVLSSLGSRRTTLRSAEIAPAPSADNQAAAQEATAVRWLDSVEINEYRRIALFMHPVARRTFRVTVPKRGRFLAWAALMPDVWTKNSGGVRFRVTVQVDGHAFRSASWVVDPGGRPSHRRWRSVSVSLSGAAGREVDLTLETTLPEGAAPGYAWAIWGDPVILERKTIGEVVRRQASVVRAIGLKAAVRRYGRLLRGHPVDSAHYDSWFRQHRDAGRDADRIRQSIDAFTWRPRVSFITPVYNTDPRWLRRLVDSVKAQTYHEWELCLADDGSTREGVSGLLDAVEREDARIKVVRLPQNAGISAASNAALAAATGEFVALVDHDDELAPDALFEVASLLNAHRDADVVYTDEDKLEFDGTHVEPYFKPDWSPEYLQSTMYIGHMTVYRRALVTGVGGFRPEFDGSQDYDLALRVTAQTDRVHHIAKILYHWRKIPGSAAGDTTAKLWALNAARRALQDHVSKLSIPAAVEDQPGNGFWRVRYAIVGNPLVTVVIPTDGRVVQGPGGSRDLLLQCLRSIVERTTYTNYELLVVDNGRLSPHVLDLLSDVPHRRLVYEMTTPFNFAAKVNFAARHARGDHLLLLNDDTEVITGEWMTAMLEFSQQPQIGAVGGKLFYPDGRIQHVGVVLGIGGGACHVLAGQAGNSPGYFGSALVIRNYSAVTGACCMTRRAVFEEVGGFDERFALDFNDVDYCLRVRARGYRIVGTPFAQLYHFEGASFGSREHVVNPAEIKALSERWSTVIEADPYYNPNLTRSGLDYSLRL